jgi:hypothetical protein
VGSICNHHPSIPPTIYPINGKPYNYLPYIYYTRMVVEDPYLGVLDPLDRVGVAPARGWS